ncbi:MAG: hypothetical protein KDC95_03490 [Planctomycetes bacterium]|nr:hypothetical protein [Planctomycetota bacterium]
MPIVTKTIGKNPQKARSEPARIEWDGVPPHHFLDPKAKNGVRRVASTIRDEAALRRRDFRESFTEALRVAIADRYSACVRYRDTNPATGRPWQIEDVPADYRGLVDFGAACALDAH